MNIVDSSGWLEYFAGGPNAQHFASPLQDIESLLVPVVTIYEVFKVVMRERDENDALQAAASMERGKVVELSASLAVAAARLSLAHRLPMADSVILAAAQSCGATVWTQDADFRNLPNVRYFPK